MAQSMEVDVRPDQLERIVEQLEEDIVFGRLHPRERLVEGDLAARFLVNRHVVRQALAALEPMGLVERKRNKGAVVRAFSAADAANVYAVRELLETHAAALVPLPVDLEIVRRLTKEQERHDWGAEAGDLRQVVRANVEFHRILFSACGNPYLVEAVELYAQKSHAIRSYPMRRPDYLRKAREEHWAMIEALRLGDRDRLVELCRRHIERSKQGYIDEYNERYGWHEAEAGAPQKAAWLITGQT